MKEVSRPKESVSNHMNTVFFVNLLYASRQNHKSYCRPFCFKNFYLWPDGIS